MDEFCKRQAIDHLATLHADIQNAEVDILHGVEQMIFERRIDYICPSTHSRSLHEQCALLLEVSGYPIIASATSRESYSTDGLVVARSDRLSAPAEIEISKRQM